MTVVFMVEIGMTIGLGGYWLFSMRHRFRLRWALRGFDRNASASGPVPPSDRSPLNLGRFSVVSVVAWDRTAIVACRARQRDKPRWLWRLPLARAWQHRRSRSRWPQLQTTDQTLVLRVGDDAEAERAWALLEQWRRAGTILCLRPTAVPSTVKLSDDGRSTLQAVLSAD